ncbi:hypothetical protein MMC31_007450 [Peltigera leucophlebia]|nr:hypothetical protein [Peltigera leucophlebia]
MAHTKRPTHKATTLPTVFAAQYGYQAIMGLGCGLNLTILILLAPSVAGKKDVAVAIGAANQFRLLGGAIGLGICTNILASKVKTDLSPVLSSEQLKAILLSFQLIEALGPAAQATVRTVYAEGYNLQMRVLIGISAAEVLATLMMWERKQSK